MARTKPESRGYLHRRLFLFSCTFLPIIFVAGALRAADSAPFDLVGPTIQVKVNRDGKSLPISSVPNLKAGDRLWVHADFPDNQAAHYVMVVAFLQGTTNPPPEDWFTK